MSEGRPEDGRYMGHALELARRAWGQTHPNPMVGAIIVEADTIVAEGWHVAAGQEHAEVAALKALGRRPKAGATLYVTLEPCSTCGQTGACTDAIIAAGFARVVVGAEDPNPAHAGRGLSLLREAGVEVVSAVLDAACEDLNLIFNHWITRGTPFIAAKMAITLDGKFAAASGHSKWVTGVEARADVMRWRRYFPAIAVGANTVLTDDPSLTARGDDAVWCPKRLILDRSLRTLECDPLPKVYRDEHRDRTIVVCHEGAPETALQRAEALGLRVWALPSRHGHLDWHALRTRCAEAGIFGVYVETGPQLATALIEGGQADYAFVYQAPKFLCDSAAPGIGSERQTESMDAAICLRHLEMDTLGLDRLIRGFIE